MRPYLPVLVLFLAGVTALHAQTTPTAPAASRPANKPLPLVVPPATTQSNPAAAPLHPASDAGATERGLAPVQPGAPGVMNRDQDAHANGRDAQGHVLDPHGRPVGQKPVSNGPENMRAPLPASATTR